MADTSNGWIASVVMWVVGGIASVITMVTAWLINKIWSNQVDDVKDLKDSLETHRTETRADIKGIHARIDALATDNATRHLQLVRMLRQR